MDLLQWPLERIRVPAGVEIMYQWLCQYDRMHKLVEEDKLSRFPPKTVRLIMIKCPVIPEGQIN